MHCTAIKCAGLAAVISGIAALPVGCPQAGPSVIVPTTETNYIGSGACGSCHSNVAPSHSRTGHAQALKPVLDGAPSYPAGPGVPTPPPGFDWPQLSYVIGGHEKAATFVDINGFVPTTGTTGINTQYNQAIPPVGITAGFVPYLPGRTTPLLFELDAFSRRTTGPASITDNGGLHQEHRPGIQGTWAEPGVQCEACHGPGSRHVPKPSAGNIELDADASACSRCHGSPGSLVEVADGLVSGFQQAAELATSPHQGFTCTVCHNPHASVFSDRASAIRNECQACHPTQNMALHQGLVFVRGDYTEALSCTSCHMPYLVRMSASIDVALTNRKTARFGDTRSHVFRLDPSPNGLAGMFTADGTQIARDSQGRASISTCYVCQRCHTGLGSVFAFPPGEACGLGSGIHGE